MRDSKQNTAVQNLDEKVVCGDVCGVCHVLCFLFSDGKRKKKAKFNYSSRACWGGQYLYCMSWYKCHTAVLAHRKISGEWISTPASRNVGIINLLSDLDLPFVHLNLELFSQ